MGEQMKVFFAACLYYSGLVKLTRWWMQRSRHRLIILNYHCAAGGDLRSHLLYLRRHYRMLRLEEALEELSLLARGIQFRRRHAKSLTERDAFLAGVREALAVPPSVTHDEESIVPLTWDEIREMEESGWLSFGAHAMHHLMLAELHDPA